MFPADEIGRLHAEALNALAIERYDVRMHQVGEFLVEMGNVPKEVVDRTITEIHQNGIAAWLVLHPQFLKPYPSADEGSFLENAAASLDLLMRSRYSSELRTAMTSLIMEIENVTSLDGFIARAEQLFSFSAAGADADAANVFLAVIRKSKQHWGGQGVPKIKPGSWVIINDGIGAILGLFFGPPGSIILGTAASVYTNEEID